MAAQLAGPFGYVVSLAFSHDGRLLAVTGNAPNTVVWNVATRKIVQILRSPVSAGAAGVAFSPDDRLLATSGVGTPTDPALLRVYVLSTGQLIGNVVTRHNTLQDLDFSPDGRLLASAGLDGKILVWNVARRALERTILHHDRDPHHPLLARRKTIATGDLSGNVNFWDAQTGRAVGHTLGGQNGFVGSVAYLDGGRELVTTSGDGKLRLWDRRLRTARRLAPTGQRRPAAGAPPSRTASTQSQSSPTAPASSGTSTRAPGRPTHAASRTATSPARSGTTSYRSAGSAPSVRNVAGVAHTTPALNLRPSNVHPDLRVQRFEHPASERGNANTGRCKSVTAVESVARMSLRGLEPDRRSSRSGETRWPL